MKLMNIKAVGTLAALIGTCFGVSAHAEIFVISTSRTIQDGRLNIRPSNADDVAMAKEAVAGAARQLNRKYDTVFVGLINGPCLLAVGHRAMLINSSDSCQISPSILRNFAAVNAKQGASGASRNGALNRASRSVQRAKARRAAGFAEGSTTEVAEANEALSEDLESTDMGVAGVEGDEPQSTEESPTEETPVDQGDKEGLPDSEDKTEEPNGE